jgi:membrane protease YdiL (CAAX protease family)
MTPLETQTEEITRRDVFRLGIAIPVGIVAASVLQPLGHKVNQEVAEATNAPAGGAYYRDMVASQCAGTAEPAKCATEFVQSTPQFITTSVVAPVFEEGYFRILPSAALDLLDREQEGNIGRNLLYGRKNLRPTRRELIASTVSSLLFGATHNLKPNSIDTRTIPASQTLSGFAFWCLQRKFGALSNVTAHSYYNYRAARSR